MIFIIEKERLSLRLLNKKPGFITSIKNWERNYRDYAAKILFL
jgi:hypothetical protein